ncbi:VOC family protein [Microbacterium rhizophilus]|uniref:VOC family protein n=1 Tax=Microbacterium rhizophilus TaxID=3138934 RepID=UPI0031E5E96C
MSAGLHHVEIWIASAVRAAAEWAWLLERLGWVRDGEWPGGFTWSAGGAYLTFTEAPSQRGGHDRRREGLNHLAFRGGSPAEVDRLVADATDHGWTPLYQDRYPHAGGPGHYAGWLENASGFKAEVVAER